MDVLQDLEENSVISRAQAVIYASVTSHKECLACLFSALTTVLMSDFSSTVHSVEVGHVLSAPMMILSFVLKFSNGLLPLSIHRTTLSSVYSTYANPTDS